MTYPQQPQYGAPAPQGYAQPPAPPQYQVPPAQPQQQMAPFYNQQDPYVQAQQPPAAPQYQAPPQAEPTAPVDTSSFFGGAASVSWDDRKGYVRGTFRGGQVVSKRVTNQTKLGTGQVITWDNGEPRKQMEITVQTKERVDPQDDGKRVIFVKGDGPRAAKAALKEVGASDVSEGGWYYQAWVDEEAAKQPGYNAKKIFKVIYAPPGAPDPNPAAIAPPPPPPPPVPQPGQGADQFAAYAAYQAQMAAQQQQQQQPQYAPQMAAQGPIAATPGQAMANFAQASQNDPAVQAAIYGQPQPGGQYAQSPIAPPAGPQQPEQWTPFAPS